MDYVSQGRGFGKNRGVRNFIIVEETSSLIDGWSSITF
jgi:hypothetical protein